MQRRLFIILLPFLIEARNTSYMILCSGVFFTRGLLMLPRKNEPRKDRQTERKSSTGLIRLFLFIAKSMSARKPYRMWPTNDNWNTRHKTICIQSGNYHINKSIFRSTGALVSPPASSRLVGSFVSLPKRTDHSIDGDVTITITLMTKMNLLTVVLFRFVFIYFPFLPIAFPGLGRMAVNESRGGLR